MINVEKKNGLYILKLEGRLDAVSAKEVKSKINEMVKHEQINIVIDLSEIDFIDSTGLGCMVSCLRSVSKKSGDIKIAGLQAQVRAIFELTRLHRIFQIFEDTETALRSFK
jgi:anti-sigma B factor antagonist